MRLIANGSQGGTTVPTPQSLVGTPGYAASGAPGTFTETICDPDIFNVVLAELAALATANGAALGGSNQQALTTVLQAAGANVTAISASGALTASMAGLILVSASSGSLSLTLPQAASAGGLPTQYSFARTDSTANTVTISLGGSDTMLIGSAPITLATGVLVRVANDGVSRWVNLNSGSGVHGIQSFTTSGTWVVPAGVTPIYVSGCAGGAGGNQYVSGAAGQPVIEMPITVTPGHTLTATIGAAGAGGSTSCTGGGTTTLVDTTASTTLLTLTGGAGASGGSAQSVGYPSGALPTANYPTQGASGPFGGGGPSGGSTSGGAGGAAYGYGAGGGQGFAATGGNGAPGFLILRW